MHIILEKILFLNKIILLYMKFVDVNDLEELVISKYLIESEKLKKNPKFVKQSLEDFIHDKCSMEFAYIENDEVFPFSIFETYVYVSNKEHKKILEPILNKVQYNITKYCKKLSTDESLKMFDEGNTPYFTYKNNTYVLF